MKLIDALSGVTGRPCDDCKLEAYCASGYACGDFYNWTLTASGMRPVKPGRYPERAIYARLFPGDFAEVEDLPALSRAYQRLRQTHARHGDERALKQQDEVAALITAHKQRAADHVSA